MPEEFTALGFQELAPWRVMVRFLLVDAPGEYLNMPEESSLFSWRMHRFESRHKKVENRTWIKRVAYSQRGQIGTFKPLAGSWMVVAYVISGDYGLVMGADTASLISFRNTSWLVHP